MSSSSGGHWISGSRVDAVQGGGYHSHVPVNPRVVRIRPGFTLIELMVVISIILFLMVVLGLGVAKIMQRSREQASIARLNNLAQALNDYYQDFQAFPPNDVTTVNGEWWRYLTLTGGLIDPRPQKPDGSIVQEPYIPEDKLGIPKGTGLKFPKDGFGFNIVYIFPTDNDVHDLRQNVVSANLPVVPLTVADLSYHCVVLSPGKDGLFTAVNTTGSITNTGAYEAAPANADNKIAKVSGQ